ncbi:MAG: phosphoribosylamine--glycine ligase, partial [Flavobacteriaceae bacterium]
DYKGFVFIGLMKVGDEPYVIEYNVRLGDPETEVVIPRLKSDLVDLLEKTSREELSTVNLEIDSQSAATVMLVSGGYPEAYEKGKEIKGLDQVNESDVFICHAGTKQKNSATVTNGGRVIAVTAFDKDFESALEKSYRATEKISFDQMYYRKDIGKDLI